MHGSTDVVSGKSGRMIRNVAVAIFLAALAAGSDLSAAQFRVRPKDSILALITHKAGFASGLAHNHLIAATEYDATLEFDKASIEATRFELHLRCKDLVADDPELRSAWQPRLRELGILDKPFSKVGEKARNKIRNSMLGEKQLDADAFPDISVSTLSVRDTSSDMAEPEFPFLETIALEVHGQRVEREFAARYSLENGELLVEAFGIVRFSDFGIKPFSTFLGAVKNEDEFHMYIRLVAAVSK